MNTTLGKSIRFTFYIAHSLNLLVMARGKQLSSALCVEADARRRTVSGLMQCLLLPRLRVADNLCAKGQQQIIFSL